MAARTGTGAGTARRVTEGRWVRGPGYRITVITPSLFRVERSRSGAWEDGATQTVLDRGWSPAPAFSLAEVAGGFELRTEAAALRFDERTRRVTRVLLADGRRSACGNRGNLKGTCRTLDMSFGPVPLGNGILSRSGVAVLDDSRSLVVGPDGEVSPRRGRGSDRYLFAYGCRYREAVADFFRLTGRTPLIPRFALGNWWSRYHAYTADEYLALMDRFKAEGVPLTVATVDMDWHWVKLRERFPESGERNGWTGYSWNTELFPDWRAFLRALKERNLRVTLNLHPADGVRPFEDAYPEMARLMGLDPAAGRTIPFDMADPRFREAYFRALHHPLEDAGVDFWWIDWQQGTKTRVPGLDPLWALNHWHWRDNGRSGKRPLVLSRYAGPGSHRYPLGFSGDTAISWRVLAFQPRFTATASNIGYAWWSHDIGGHHMGRRDDELYLRWLQLGVFSPILRLHSTALDFLGKEPWKFRFDVELLAKEALRLRHRLIPYLYSLNRRCHADGRVPIEPMYYAYPDEADAYRVPNQFLFGPSLMVCPIVGKADPRVNLASVRAWIPAGRWTDAFTGRVYEGPRRLTLHRDLRSVPVLAREGAIVPLAAGGELGNGCGNPAELELWVYRGAGSFDLYEDDGESMAYERGAFAVTRMAVSDEGGRLAFAVEPATGDRSVLPAERNLVIRFRDAVRATGMAATVDGRPADAVWGDEGGCVTLRLSGVKPSERVEAVLDGVVAAANPPYAAACLDLVSRWQAGTARKRPVYERLAGARDARDFRARVERAALPRALKGALLENLPRG